MSWEKWSGVELRKLERVRFEDIDLEDTTYCARLDFTEEDIQRMANSIEENGLMNPPHYIRVGKRLIVNAGWRRTFGIQKLGWEDLDAWVSYNITGEKAHLQNLSDNIDREDLSVLEIAGKVQILRENEIPVEKIAQRLGKGTQHVYDLLKLTTMPEEIQYAVHRGDINLYHAIEIFKFDDSKYLEILAQCIDERWSVGHLKRMRQGGLEQEILRRREETADRIVAEAAEKGVDIDRDELLRRISQDQKIGLPNSRKVWLTHKGWVVDIPYDWKERQEKRLGMKIVFVSVKETEDGSLMVTAKGGESQ